MRSELLWELLYADDLAKWTLHVQIGSYQKQNGVMAEDLKVYEAIIIPALTCERMLRAMKVNNKRKIATTEVRMLRGILGVLRRDHMRNNDIRRILHFSRTMLYSGRLRWFGNVQRRYENTVTRRAMDLAIPGTRRRGRPRRHGTNRSRTIWWVLPMQIRT